MPRRLRFVASILEEANRGDQENGEGMKLILIHLLVLQR